MTNQQDTWPAGATWVFQGTVAEDATGGTHVCSLTVTPGVGNEMQVLFGEVTEGNTATAQTTTIRITDGTNMLARYGFNTDTSANIIHDFPTNTIPAANTSNGMSGPALMATLSGTMAISLQVSTTAISVTQTFAIVCRIKGAMPTATLADTVGAPALTTNTNKVF